MPRRSIAKAEGAQGPDKRPQTRRRRSRKVNRAMTDGLVQLVNLPLSLFAGEYALEDHEVQALSGSLLELAQANQYVAQIIVNLANAKGWGSFPVCVGAILAKRLAKAGQLPEMAALPADALLYALAGGAVDMTGTRPEPAKADMVEVA